MKNYQINNDIKSKWTEHTIKFNLHRIMQNDRKGSLDFLMNVTNCKSLFHLSGNWQYRRQSDHTHIISYNFYSTEILVRILFI